MKSRLLSAFEVPFANRMKRASKVVSKMTVISLGFVFLFSACGKEEEMPTPEVVRPVKMITITAGLGLTKRSFPGKVQASKEVDLAFKVSGPLIDLPVKEGQELKKGDLVAKIDPRDFKTELDKIDSSLGEARAKLRAMLAGARPEDIKVLEAEIKAAEARALNAEQQYIRYKDLFIQQQVSKADFDKFKSERDVARAQLNTAKQNLDTGKKGARKEDVEAMKSNIKGLEAQRKGTQDALMDTRLRAPFAGFIATRFVDNFQEVQAKQPIVSLQDVSSVEIDINVPELLVARGKRHGDITAEAAFAAVPGKQYPLSVKEFATAADPKTQAYKVTLLMLQPEDANILPGMTASVTITRSAETDTTISIPATAVFADETGASHVWVFNPDDQTVKLRPVTTGNLTGSENIQIDAGLETGDIIAIAGVSLLREEMKVRPAD